MSNFVFKFHRKLPFVFRTVTCWYLFWLWIFTKYLKISSQTQNIYLRVGMMILRLFFLFCTAILSLAFLFIYAVFGLSFSFPLKIVFSLLDSSLNFLIFYWAFSYLKSLWPIPIPILSADKCLITYICKTLNALIIISLNKCFKIVISKWQLFHLLVQKFLIIYE